MSRSVLDRLDTYSQLASVRRTVSFLKIITISISIQLHIRCGFVEDGDEDVGGALSRNALRRSHSSQHHLWYVTLSPVFELFFNSDDGSKFSLVSHNIFSSVVHRGSFVRGKNF